MALQWQTFSIPFVKGLSTGKDPFLLDPGELTQASNAIFPNPGAVQRRSAFVNKGSTLSAGGSILKPMGIAARSNELLYFANHKCFTFDDYNNEWASRGAAMLAKVSRNTISGDWNKPIRPDRAEQSGVAMYAWEETGPSGPGVQFEFIDTLTGARIEKENNAILSNGASPVCIAVKDGFHLYYIASQKLWLKVITLADIYGTSNDIPIEVIGTGGGELVTGTLHATYKPLAVGGRGATYAGVPSYPVVAVALSSLSIMVVRMYYTGALDTYATLTNPANTEIRGLAVEHDPASNQYAITWTSDETVLGAWACRATEVSSSLVSTLSSNRLIYQGLQGAELNMCTLTFYHDGTDWVGRVFFDVLGTNSTPSSPEINDRVFRVKWNVSNDDVDETKVLVRNSRLASHAILQYPTPSNPDAMSNRSMVIVAHNDVGGWTDDVGPQTDDPLLLTNQQPCYVLMDCERVVGDDDGTTVLGEEPGHVARLCPDIAAHVTNINRTLPKIQYFLPGGDTREEQFKTILLTDTDYVSVSQWTQGLGLEEQIISIGFGDVYKPAAVGESIYFPGGHIGMYDGERFRESGFWLTPEGIQITSQFNAGSGMTGSSDYAYEFYWHRISARGEIAKSGYIGRKVVSLDAAHNECAITVPILPYVSPGLVALVIYRTTADPGDSSPAYRVTSPDPSQATFVANDYNSTTGAITFTDTLADTALEGREASYINEDTLTSELENRLPPVCPTFVGEGANRLFTAGTLYPNRLYYSKQKFAGEEVAFSGVLFIDTPDFGGRITAAVGLDNGVIIFKERAVYFAGGEGPDNTGQNPYGTPQLINAGVGCKGQQTVARTPVGIFFEADTGIYNIDENSMTVRFIGHAAHSFTDGNNIMGTAVDEDNNRVIFFSDAGGSPGKHLSYDWVASTWADWTAAGGNAEAACSWRGAPVVFEMVSGTGGVYEYTPGTYVDTAGDNLVLETGWIKPANLHGFSKMRWWELSGKLLSGVGSEGCKITVLITYNDGEDSDTYITDSQTQGWSAGQVWTIRSRPVSVRKIRNFKVKVTISDISGAYTIEEGVELYGLTVELGFKPGTFHLDKTSTV